MTIGHTCATEIPALNEIILKSKSHWDYDLEYLKHAIPLILINDDWLNQNLGYSIYFENELCGFLGIETTSSHWILEHLWIHPNFLGRGFGRKAIDYLLSEAHRLHKPTVYLLPDPPAEGFYLKLGARLTGRTVPSRVVNGPIFREMVFEIISR